MDALREVHFLLQQMPHFVNIIRWSFLLVHFSISVWLKKIRKALSWTFYGLKYKIISTWQANANWSQIGLNSLPCKSCSFLFSFLFFSFLFFSFFFFSFVLFSFPFFSFLFFSFLNFVNILVLIILRRVEMAKCWQHCKFFNLSQWPTRCTNF